MWYLDIAFLFRFQKQGNYRLIYNGLFFFITCWMIFFPFLHIWVHINSSCICAILEALSQFQMNCQIRRLIVETTNCLHDSFLCLTTVIDGFCRLFSAEKVIFATLTTDMATWHSVLRQNTDCVPQLISLCLIVKCSKTRLKSFNMRRSNYLQIADLLIV